jgi:hemerythrin
VNAGQPPPLAWSEHQHGLGMEAMDRHHARFAELVNELATAGNDQFAALFARLNEHTRVHFGEEQALMEQSGFPGMREHSAEHQRVLGELAQFQQRVQRGLTVFARSYVRDRLGEWFVLHLTSMDANLAAHLRRR